MHSALGTVVQTTDDDAEIAHVNNNKAVRWKGIDVIIHVVPTPIGSVTSYVRVTIEKVPYGVDVPPGNAAAVALIARLFP